MGEDGQRDIGQTHEETKPKKHTFRDVERKVKFKKNNNNKTKHKHGRREL